jgi:hypothetical protein
LAASVPAKACHIAGPRPKQLWRLLPRLRLGSCHFLVGRTPRAEHVAGGIRQLMNFDRLATVERSHAKQRSASDRAKLV